MAVETESRVQTARDFQDSKRDSLTAPAIPVDNREISYLDSGIVRGSVLSVSWIDAWIAFCSLAVPISSTADLCRVVLEPVFANDDTSSESARSGALEVVRKTSRSCSWGNVHLISPSDLSSDDAVCLSCLKSLNLSLFPVVCKTGQHFRIIRDRDRRRYRPWQLLRPNAR